MRFSIVSTRRLDEAANTNARITGIKIIDLIMFSISFILKMKKPVNNLQDLPLSPQNNEIPCLIFLIFSKS
jgi:hypothetical protein